MNKKLVALAVAGAFTAPGLAVAQTSQTPTAIVPSPGIATSGGITLYGRLDEAIMLDKYSQSGSGAISSVKKSDLFSAGNAMGFRGREDLGGGTTAWFQLEIGVWPDGRLDSGTTGGNNWGGRNSAIGFSSGAGDILLGIWDTPYKQTFGVWNSVTSGGFSSAGVIMGNGDSTGALNAPGCATTVNNGTGAITTTPVCATEVTAGSTQFSRRINNSVQYWTPILAGFQAKFMTALANYQLPSSAAGASGTVKPKEYSASLSYVRGPLSAGLGYDFHQGLRPNAAAGAEANPKDTGIQLGVKWNFGPGEIGAAYEQLEYKSNGTAATPAAGMKVPSWVVNGRWNIGPGAVWVNYSKSDGGKSCSTTATTVGSAACGVEVKEGAIGYDYVLSKRTKMYVAYNKIDNGFANGIGTTYYYIAGPAANNPGTAGGLAAGTDVTTFAFGVQHVF
jgi:predicted porin